MMAGNPPRGGEKKRKKTGFARRRRNMMWSVTQKFLSNKKNVLYPSTFAKEIPVLFASTRFRCISFCRKGLLHPAFNRGIFTLRQPLPPRSLLWPKQTFLQAGPWGVELKQGPTIHQRACRYNMTTEGNCVINFSSIARIPPNMGLAVSVHTQRPPSARYNGHITE